MITDDVELADDVVIHHPDLVNLYGCKIGMGSRIGPFVEIQKGSSIGAHCRISSHSFICECVHIEDGVFLGHGVVFCNDNYPRSISQSGRMLTEEDYQLLTTRVGRRASIGSNATVIGGITIGESAMVGAGAVVTKDVPAYAIVKGVPARVTGDVRERE